MNCLICDMKKESASRATCKLCGMYSTNLSYSGFRFCCNKCVDYFKNIVSIDPEALEREVVI